jgi:flavin-dependent dehydrogenase
MKDVIIIGGGIAGLVNAIRLADAGLEVLVIEKKTYPFHRVCGEYISNEALPFLRSIGADPELLGPSRIRNLVVSSPGGSIVELPLKMGGIGVSRFALDNFLYSVAVGKGVEFRLNTAVTEVRFEGE